MGIFDWFKFNKKKSSGTKIHTIADEKEGNLIKYLEAGGGEISIIVNRLVEIYDNSHPPEKKEFIDLCIKLKTNYKNIYESVQREWNKNYGTNPKYGFLEILSARGRKVSPPQTKIQPQQQAKKTTTVIYKQAGLGKK